MVTKGCVPDADLKVKGTAARHRLLGTHVKRVKGCSATNYTGAV